MELVFAYIKDFKILKNQQFNFSTEVEFFYDLDSKELSFKEKHDPLSGFWGNKVKSITGIVGINGSGKTTLLEYLIKQRYSIVKDHILVYRNYQDPKYVVWHGVEISNNLNPVLYYIDVSGDTVRHPAVLEPKSRLIYFSNFYSGQSLSPQRKGIEFEKNDVLDISSDSFVTRTIWSKKGATQYEIDEKIRMIHLISDLKNIFPNDFPNPEYIFLEPNLFDLNDLLPDNRSYIDPRVKIFVTELNKKLKDEVKDNFGLKTSLLIAILIAFEFKNSGVELDVFDDSTLAKLISNDNENISSALSKSINQGFENGSELQTELINVLEGVDSIQEQSAFELSSQNLELDKLEALFKSINLFKFDRFYPFEVVWSFDEDRNPVRFSGGQQTLYSLFARLHELDLGDDYSDLLILLDEPDISLHPNWQKDFISLFLNFVKLAYPDRDKNSIQILITTHSPFIISDLPIDNVLYLGEDPPAIDSFAANIHDLLAHSYFMKEGFVGNFAKMKINKLVKFLTSDENSTLAEEEQSYSKEYAEFLISKVGEPTIKFQLEKMFRIKYQISDSEYIVQLQNELKLLKQRKK